MNDNTNKLKQQWLINAGYFPPVIFWTTNIICGMLQPNYNHATRLVSELGELGTSTQYLFTAGLFICFSSYFALFSISRSGFRSASALRVFAAL